MKIEISEGQQKQLLAIISNANIKVAEGPAVMVLTRAVQTPAAELKTIEEKEKEALKG